MARAVALTAPLRSASFEALRMALVYGCAIALITAGQALPL